MPIAALRLEPDRLAGAIQKRFSRSAEAAGAGEAA
jgi:hypothetical protein